MSYEFKIATVYFPETAKTREMMFRKDDHLAVSVLNNFLLANKGFVMDVESFEDWEIEFLTEAKTADGEPLFQPTYSSEVRKPEQ